MATLVRDALPAEVDEDGEDLDNATFRLSLTDAEVEGSLRRLAEGDPDFIYLRPDGRAVGTCYYFHGQEPGCIVGHILAEYGVRGDDMLESNWLGVGELVEAGVLDLSLRSTALLNRAQGSQDAGYTWGEAVAVAFENVDADLAELRF